MYVEVTYSSNQFSYSHNHKENTISAGHVISLEWEFFHYYLALLVNTGHYSLKPK